MEPTRVPELLAYQLTIIKAAQSYDGLQWRAYDAHFRVAAAAPGKKSWSKLDVDLYTRFFTGRAKVLQCCAICDSSQHSATSCPLPAARRKEGYKPSPALPSKRRRSWGPNVCQLYNSSSCPFGLKCKFKHSCGDYGGAHSAKVCTFTPKQTEGGSDCGSRPPAAVARRPDLLDGSMYTPKKLIVPFSACSS